LGVALHLGTRKLKKRPHVVFVCVESAQRGEVCGAGGSFRDKGVAAVSIGEWMDSPHELVMEMNQAFVDRKCTVVEPVFRDAEQLRNPRQDLLRVAAQAEFVSLLRGIEPGFAKQVLSKPRFLQRCLKRWSDVQRSRELLLSHIQKAGKPTNQDLVLLIECNEVCYEDGSGRG
jgi:hypothetical protein